MSEQVMVSDVDIIEMGYLIQKVSQLEDSLHRLSEKNNYAGLELSRQKYQGVIDEIIENLESACTSIEKIIDEVED